MNTPTQIEYEQKWKEYEHLTELYKTYLNVMVNLGAFSFAAIGGITTYILKDDTSELQKWAILLPLFFSIGLTYLYVKSIKPAYELKNAFDKLGDQILNVELKPHAFLLKDGIVLLAILYAAISIGLIVIGGLFLCGYKP